MNNLIKINTDLTKADAYIQVANKLLANFDISSHLLDKDRIKRAIELAINARIFLDPYFQQSELFTVNKEQLLQDILLEFTSQTGTTVTHKIKVPKNKQDDRTSIYIDLQSYSIRYLLCLILSEKIPISNNVFGGKKEIFVIDNSEPYENEINKFWKLQNEILLSNSFSWIVYVDIAAYYDSIKNEIIIEQLKRKLSLSSQDIFILLCKKYLQDISIGSFCDNFFQNVYLSDLDSLLQPYSWKYIRLTDDIRVFCNSKEEAEMALQIIRQQLEKMNLKVNPSKCFTIKPKTTLKEFRTNKDEYQQDEISNILQLSQITEYPVENVFLLSYNSHQHKYFLDYKYNTDFPKELSYQDEILQKMGYQIEGRDIKDILSDIEHSELLNGENYKILIKILANAYHTFRVYQRIIRLYVSSLLKENDLTIASNIFADLVSHLSNNCHQNSQLYLSYCFIRIVFIEPHYFKKINSYRDLINRNIMSCWNLFYQIIKLNSTDNYLCKEIRYMFDSEIFKLSHKEKENLIKRDDFWNSLIEKEINSVEFGNYIHSHTDNVVYFLDGQFTTSTILNLSRATFYYKRKKYKKARELFLLVKANNPPANIDFKLGYCHYHEEMYQESVFHYSEYLKRYVSDVAFNNRALSHQRLKHYDNSIADFTKAIELGKNKALYYGNRSTCYLEMNLPEDALCDLNAAIQFNEQLNRPDIYWLNNNVNYSFEDHNRDVMLYYYRAQVKKIIGDIDGAKKDLHTYCVSQYTLKDKYEDSGFSKREFNRLSKKLLEES
jgi:hypothetical protein